MDRLHRHAVSSGGSPVPQWVHRTACSVAQSSRACALTCVLVERGAPEGVGAGIILVSHDEVAALHAVQGRTASEEAGCRRVQKDGHISAAGKNDDVAISYAANEAGDWGG